MTSDNQSMLTEPDQSLHSIQGMEVEAPLTSRHDEAQSPAHEDFTQLKALIDNIDQKLIHQAKTLQGNAQLNFKLHQRVAALEDLDLKLIKPDVDWILDGIKNGTLLGTDPKILSRIGKLEKHLASNGPQDQIHQLQKTVAELSGRLDKAISAGQSKRGEQSKDFEGFKKDMFKTFVDPTEKINLLAERLNHVEQLLANAEENHKKLRDQDGASLYEVHDSVQSILFRVQTIEDAIHAKLGHAIGISDSYDRSLKAVQDGQVTMSKRIKSFEVLHGGEDSQSLLGRLQIQITALNMHLEREIMMRKMLEGKVKVVEAIHAIESEVLVDNVFKVLDKIPNIPKTAADAVHSYKDQVSSIEKWTRKFVDRTERLEDLKPVRSYISRMLNGETLPPNIPVFDNCGGRLETIVAMFEEHLPSEQHAKLIGADRIFKQPSSKPSPTSTTTRKAKSVAGSKRRAQGQSKGAPAANKRSKTKASDDSRLSSVETSVQPERHKENDPTSGPSQEIVQLPQSTEKELAKDDETEHVPDAMAVADTAMDADDSKVPPTPESPINDVSTFIEPLTPNGSDDNNHDKLIATSYDGNDSPRGSPSSKDAGKKSSVMNTVRGYIFG